MSEIKNSILNKSLEKIKNSINWNGFFTTTDLEQWNINKKEFHELLNEKLVTEHTEGWFYITDYFFDVYFYLSLLIPQGIFTANCSSFFHNMTTQFIYQFFLIIPENTLSHYESVIKKNISENLYITLKEEPKEMYEMGIMNFKTTFGSIVKITNREKTLCDVIKYRKEIEVGIFYETICDYFSSEYHEINWKLLSEYARKTNLSNEINFLIKNWNNEEKTLDFFYEE